MARVFGTLTAAAAVACTATPKTVLQAVAGSNHRAVICSWGVSFNGVSGVATPVLVETIRQTDAGTGTGVVPVKVNPTDDETIVTQGISNCSGEPAGTSVISKVLVHPQGGYQETFPFGQEIGITGSALRFGIRVTAPANVDCVPYIRFEE